MHYRVTGESMEMASKTSQTVFVYAKLQSFIPAATEVIKLLKEVLKDDGVEVKSYNEYNKDVDKKNATIVVVIDSRQTRTLITPDRGDKTVDHVSELAKLELETSPQGSILILIYGDEKSRNLREGEHIGEHWLQTWQFNDTNARGLADGGKIFSLYTTFTETQKDKLHQYFRYIPLTPDVRANTSTIVIGEKCKQQVSRLFSDHPMYRKLATDETGTETEYYGYYHFKTTKGKEPRFRIDCNSSIREVKVCESSDVAKALESQFMELNATKYGAANAGPELLKRQPDVYDNALLSCHCGKCYKMIMDKQQVATTELKKAGIGLNNDVVPIVSEDMADEVAEPARKYVNDVRSKTNEKSIESLDMSGKSLLAASILTACQSAKQKSFWEKYRKYILIACVIILFVVVFLAIMFNLVISPTSTDTTMNMTTQEYVTNTTMNMTTPEYATLNTTTKSATTVNATTGTTNHTDDNTGQTPTSSTHQTT